MLFGEIQPSSTPGAYPLTFRGRWTAWAVSAGVCPIVSLLILLFAPEPYEQRDLAFPSAVGAVGIVFGLTTAWMMGRFYAEPVQQLKSAAHRVSEGQLEARVDVLRADDFGPLISEFNEMVAGLREKERIRETFGLHVGSDAAEQILMRDPGLGGAEQQRTIMFVDIRNFTASCRGRQPQEVVSLLNEFLTEMVDAVQHQRGMVNKYLGDGFMALFGAADEATDHADAALQAGSDMLERLDMLNQRLLARSIAPFGIGIGIHTGQALVGSIASETRLEYTAIGDAVNVASRVESLTKTVGTPLLLTAATREQLKQRWDLTRCDSQTAKGLSEPLDTFTLASINLG